MDKKRGVAFVVVIILLIFSVIFKLQKNKIYQKLKFHFVVNSSKPEEK